MRPKLRKTPFPYPDPDPDPDSFYSALTRVAVAQICKQSGFKSTTESTLFVLTRLTMLHLQSLASAAASCSNLSGRSESNLFDIANAVYDLVLSNNVDCLPGIAFTSPFGSKTTAAVDGLIEFVKSSEEMPFAKPIPRRLQPLEALTCNSEHSRPKHVPKWMPAFPDTATHIDERVPSSNALISTPRRNLWGEHQSQHVAVDGETEEAADYERVDHSQAPEDGGDLALGIKKFKFKFNFRVRKGSITRHVV